MTATVECNLQKTRAKTGGLPYDMIQIIHRVFLIASFAMWFGGFGFYVSFVVPVGTDVLGSAFAQGMITRQVSHWLNVVSAVAFAAMLIESGLDWNPKSLSIWRVQFGLWILMIGSLFTLAGLHPMLDAMIDLEAGSVSDSDRFYDLHRIYLWVSTVQWFAGWIWLILMVVNWRIVPISSSPADA